MQTTQSTIRQPGEEGRSVSARANDAADAIVDAFNAYAGFPATGSRPLHIFRLGPIYDRTSGELLATIADDLLSELARVFPLQRADGQTVPIDWAHGSEYGATPEEAGPLGEVTALRHVPGQGMWAECAWTARGIRTVGDGAPAIYTSPAFDMSPVYSKRTGEQLGTAYLRSLALTDRPRQDRLEPVCLSEVTPPAASRKGAIAMADTATAAPAQPAGTLAPPPAAPTPAPAAPVVVDTSAQPADLPSAIAIIAALREQLAAKEVECEGLKAAMPEMEAEADPKKQPCAEPAPAALAEVAALTRKVTLAEKAAAEANAKADRIEKARAAERTAARLDLAERDGWYAPSAERRSYLVKLSEQAPALFEAELARLAKNPEVPLGEVGHGRKPEVVTETAAEKLDKAIVTLCDANKWDRRKDYDRAYKAVKATNPALVAAASKEG